MTMLVIATGSHRRHIECQVEFIGERDGMLISTTGTTSGRPTDMVMGTRNPALLATVYGLAASSILVTRVFKAFTLAEVLAVAAFSSGLLVLLHQRRQQPGSKLALPERLIVVASAAGLAGLPIKLLFTLLGIGAPGHDPASHADTGGNPVLLHIHHVFFNVGFLMLLISAIAWFAGRKDKTRT
jgi:hypothetical protein